MHQPGSHEYFMQFALAEAQRAADAEEVPIGAVVVINNRVIARGHNQVETLNDPTAHAEMLALTSAFNYLGSKYLPDASLYVTVEPCLMCCGALYWSKIARVVFGAHDTKNGYSRIARDVWPLHPKTELVTGVLEADCANMVKNFFKTRR